MTTTINPIARDPNPIELNPSQIDNYTVRPEQFKVRRYDDPIREPFHGQSVNDAAAAKRSNERFNSGSQRAQGNVNSAGVPRTKSQPEG